MPLVFPKVKHKLPKAFEIKIQVDELYDRFFGLSNVIKISDFKRIRAAKLNAREDCIKHTKKQRGSNV